MEQTVKGLLEIVIQQMNELTSIYRTAMSRSGISENEFWIWYILLLTGGEHSQQDICNTWFFSKQTVNTIIARRVRNGYALLEVVPGTRNRKNIRLTEKGRQLVEEKVRPVIQLENDSLLGMEPDEREMFIRLYEKYVENFRRGVKKMVGEQNR